MRRLTDAMRVEGERISLLVSMIIPSYCDDVAFMDQEIAKIFKSAFDRCGGRFCSDLPQDEEAVYMSYFISQTLSDLDVRRVKGRGRGTRKLVRDIYAELIP